MSNPKYMIELMAVVLLGKGMFGLGVPSKAYNLIAAGLLLFVGPKDSEISNLVNENELGWTFTGAMKMSLFLY